MTSTQFRRGDKDIRGKRHWGNDGERMRRKENIFYRVKRDVIKMKRESKREEVDQVSVCFHVLSPLQ